MFFFARAEEATKVWLNEVGLELPRASEGGGLKKIRQLADVGRFLNRLLGNNVTTSRSKIVLQII